MDFCESNPGGCRGIKQPLQAEPGIAASAGAPAAAESASASAAPPPRRGGGGGGSAFGSGIEWGAPRASDVYDAVAETAKIMQRYAPVAGAIGIVAASMLPYVGDAMDVKDIVSPSSTPTDRIIGGVSLAFGLMSAGFLPNAGAIKRAAAMLSDARVVQAFEVGAYDVLKARSVVGDGLDLHHAGQAHGMEQVVPGYSRGTGP